MNDVCKTIKPSPEWLSKEFFDAIHSSAEGERPSIDLDDVKPAAEPDWTTALVVRDRDGDYWGHDGENRWICLSFDDPEAVAEGSTNAALSMLGPVAVIIDTDGNNIEAEELGVELAQSRGKVRQLREQLAEAVRARETTALDKESLVIALRNSRSAFARLDHENARLDHENARLQAQLGDGR